MEMHSLQRARKLHTSIVFQVLLYSICHMCWNEYNWNMISYISRKIQTVWFPHPRSLLGINITGNGLKEMICFRWSIGWFYCLDNSLNIFSGERWNSGRLEQRHMHYFWGFTLGKESSWFYRKNRFRYVHDIYIATCWWTIGHRMQ
jgi:hypothetical protein